ncbi:GntR family transcriptional regulator [uncultured Roseibium sp.]|uniref:GntR family transcriptional regulator n=1 Tax=uncultured Roseibium sp. TaxID=1936171 RepID=UPI0032173314
MEPKSRKRGQSSAEVAEAIRQAIRAGDLLPGMQVKQADWAQRLGVSRVPVREALGILESEGLLAHEPHQGFAVATLTDSEIRQLYLLRRLIDREIAATVVWPTEAVLDQLRAIDQQAEAAIAANDIAQWLSSNDRFVLGVYALCPLEILVGEATKLWRRTETVRSSRVRYEWNTLSPEAIRQTVGRILKMLETQDRSGLKAALGRLTHIRKANVARAFAP